jgi:hypothetical protein
MQEPVSFPEEYLSDNIADAASVNRVFQRLRWSELVIDYDSKYYDKK